MAGGAVAGARGAGGSRMPENISYANCCEAGELAMRPDWPGTGRARPSGTARPLWEAPALSTVLIVTTAVDVVGNLLVILSVLRNRKLRNAELRAY
uniref:Melatonin receptor 1B n=1 Tax=Felis catus TaxID=9685 RepID=A0ABI7YW02_FELCA